MNENIITLPILGEIKLEYKDLEYDYWLRQYQFHRTTIDIDVHFKTLTTTAIEQVSLALEKFKELLEIGNKGILKDFNTEIKGETRLYIEEWNANIFEQIFTKPEFELFISDTDSSLNIEERLLHKLKFVRIGIYSEYKEEAFVVLDYAFGDDYEDGKGFRDDMLVVRLDADFKIVNISSEG